VVADDMAVHAWFCIVIVTLVCISERISSSVIQAPETHPDHPVDQSPMDTKDPTLGKHEIGGHSLGYNPDDYNVLPRRKYQGHYKPDDKYSSDSDSMYPPDEGYDGSKKKYQGHYKPDDKYSSDSDSMYPPGYDGSKSPYGSSDDYTYDSDYDPPPGKYEGYDITLKQLKLMKSVNEFKSQMMQLIDSMLLEMLASCTSKI